MKRILAITLFASCAAALGGAIASAQPASIPAVAVATQDPAPKPDERADVKELIAKLLGHADQRGKEDQEACATIDTLLKDFENYGPKDRVSVVKALGKVFTEKRQEDQDGVRQNSMFLAAAVALGRMGPESAPVLMDWIGHKSHRKDVALQRKLIDSLGRTKVEAGRGVLIKLLTDDESQIQAAAMEALGQYSEIELKLRKDTFEAVLKQLMSLRGAMLSDSTDLIARESYDAVVGPAMTTLRELSKHEESTPEEWQRWWNKNKRADWDKE